MPNTLLGNIRGATGPPGTAAGAADVELRAFVEALMAKLQGGLTWQELYNGIQNLTPPPVPIVWDAGGTTWSDVTGDWK